MWARPGPKPQHGRYCELVKDGVSWMSDLPAEIEESRDFLDQLEAAPRNSSILMLGLGLGVLIQAMLDLGHKGPVEVIEIDERVAGLVGSQYLGKADQAGMQLRIVMGDAYSHPLPEEAHWDLCYADIWAAIEEQNLPEIERIRRYWGPHCGWLGCWSEKEALWLRGEREAGRIVPGVPVRIRTRV